MTDLAIVNTVLNAEQTGDLKALRIPVGELNLCVERGLLHEFVGVGGGTYVMVTKKGKELLSR